LFLSRNKIYAVGMIKNDVFEIGFGLLRGIEFTEHKLGQSIKRIIDVDTIRVLTNEVFPAVFTLDYRGHHRQDDRFVPLFEVFQAPQWLVGIFFDASVIEPKQTFLRQFVSNLPKCSR
jgi:hypothetical protein